MKNSLLLLASFAGLVACFGEKPKEEAQEGQTATETCPADAATTTTPPAVTEEPAAATTEPTAPAAAQ